VKGAACQVQRVRDLKRDKWQSPGYGLRDMRRLANIGLAGGCSCFRWVGGKPKNATRRELERSTDDRRMHIISGLSMGQTKSKADVDAIPAYTAGSDRHRKKRKGSLTHQTGEEKRGTTFGEREQAEKNKLPMSRQVKNYSVLLLKRKSEKARPEGVLKQAKGSHMGSSGQPSLNIGLEDRGDGGLLLGEISV